MIQAGHPHGRADARKGQAIGQWPCPDVVLKTESTTAMVRHSVRCVNSEVTGSSTVKTSFSNPSGPTFSERRQMAFEPGKNIIS